MLTTFVDKYNVAVEVAKVDPTKVSTVISNGNHNDYIKETSLQVRKTRFYGLLCGCNDNDDCTVCAMGASSLIRGERIRKTGDRLILCTYK